MKVKVLILFLFFSFAGGAIAAKVVERQQTYQINLPQFSCSWADFARMMEVYR